MHFDQFIFLVAGVGLVAFGLSSGFLPLCGLGVFLLLATPKAEQMATEVIETSPPGDGCALVGALVTVALPGVIVIGLILVAMGVI